CLAAGKPPCWFVHGEGNAAAGVIGCGADGLQGVDIDSTQDDVNGSCAGGSAACTSPAQITTSGIGPRGASVARLSSANCIVIGACSDFPTFCTGVDPQSQRGRIATVSLTTGTATGEFTNANGVPDNTVCRCRTGDPACSPAQCTGPWTVTGSPLDCAQLQAT